MRHGHRIWGRVGRLCLYGLLGIRCSLAAEPNDLRPWPEYRTIMWIGDTAYQRPDRLPLFFQRMREMGVNTAMVSGDGDPRPLVDAKFPYYVENMVNKGLCLKWSSNVQDWDKFVTTWAKSGRPDSALVRDYCLDDPAWRKWAREEVQRIVQKNAPNEPVAYNIRDELSTTLSANPFDYDFNPITLESFRAWLRTQYSDLNALNAEWETTFASWNDVRPFTTDEIKNRMASGNAAPVGKPDWQALESLTFDSIAARKNPTRWNFSPWCDFRTYMDLSLARALDDIRSAAHEADPHTPVGIEGAQAASAFGGYDLWRLSRAVDWMEPYDVGNSREILGSFMPGQPILTTVFEKDADHTRRRLWHLLLEGDRGCIVWWSEDCIDWNSPNYDLTPKALALAPVLREMQSPLAQLFLRAKREYDPIAILYSQPSIQVDWLLESTVDGSTWLRRFSSFEADHNRLVKIRNGWLKAFQDAGYSPQFVSMEQVENGALTTNHFAALVLPEMLACSAGEDEKIAQLAGDEKTTVFSQGTPGLFDQHGKLREPGPLETLFPPASSNGRISASTPDGMAVGHLDGDIASYPAARLAAQPSLDLGDWFRQVMPQLNPEIAVPTASRTRIYRYQLGKARLLAFERGVDYHMSEALKQAGGNQNLEQPINLDLKLGAPMHVYDLRTQKYLGQADHIAFTLDPWQPTLFALLSDKIADGKLFEFLETQQ